MSQRFRLGIVLRLREMAEEAARIELGDAIAAHQRSLAAVEAAQARLGDELRWLRDLQSGTAEAGMLRAAADSIAAAQRAAGAARDRLARTGDALFESRGRLAEATRRREVVERLRDRFLAAQRREADRLDALTMAEIASSQYIGRASGGGS